MQDHEIEKTHDKKHKISFNKLQHIENFYKNKNFNVKKLSWDYLIKNKLNTTAYFNTLN